MKVVGYFVDYRGFLRALIETKVAVLLDAIAKKYMSQVRIRMQRDCPCSRYPASVEAYRVRANNRVMEVMDNDKITNLQSMSPPIQATAGATFKDPATSSTRRVCVGISLTFPSGKNHHTACPFGREMAVLIGA